MSKTHIQAANEAENRGMTLREATIRFLDGALPEDVLAAAEIDEACGAMTLKMLRAFQEGAFWACWRLHHEQYQENPKAFDVMCSILEEHANARDIAQGGGETPPH